MKNRFVRVFLYVAVIFLLAFIFQYFTVNFSGEGFQTPEEALPKDAEYVWIEGPKREKEHRYFFLSNGNYFGTGVVEKNFKGWKSGEGAYAKLPNPLKDNEITSAYSDGYIIFGLIKQKGEVVVTVNDVKANIIELSTIPKETRSMYKIEDYSIWYVDLEKLEDKEHFNIKVQKNDGEILSELSI
ncbi:MAG: hypothetical protein GX072_03935 [Lysinibacillus sp.]|nr:hypothetical protein [Lysinibacillus sp.]